MKCLVWQSRITSATIKVRILLLFIFVIFSFRLVYQFFDFRLQLLAVIISELHAHIYDVFNGDVWDSILFTKFLSKVCLTGAWWPSNEYFKREQASEMIELIVEHLHSVLVDSSWALPINTVK